MELTVREQKALIAEALITQAGTLAESWGEMSQTMTSNPDAAQDIDVEFVRECLATWLKRLPGTAWDVRLGNFEN
jgi:hypothetical protein